MQIEKIIVIPKAIYRGILYEYDESAVPQMRSDISGSDTITRQHLRISGRDVFSRMQRKPSSPAVTIPDMPKLRFT
jgi:hypothetical protein